MSFNLLVVDDDYSLRMFYSRLLRIDGYNVRSAPHGKEALSVIEKNGTIDLLISDIEMPVMNGIELVKVLKEKESKIPVLFISGTEDNSKIHELRNLGCNNYLKKPVRLSTLRENVKNILEQAK